MPCDAAKTTAIINNINKERINKVSLRWPGLPLGMLSGGTDRLLHRPDPHQLSQQITSPGAAAEEALTQIAVSGQMRQVSWCPKSASETGCVA